MGDYMGENNPGVFINGKAQVIEMLQHMTYDEREKLISNIRARNSQLADELLAQSLNLDIMERLSDHEIRMIFQYINAPIMGVALKALPQKTQRRVLTIAERDYAEGAYKLMITPLQNEKRDVGRAKAKVLGVIASLIKRKQINI